MGSAQLSLDRNSVHKPTIGMKLSKRKSNLHHNKDLGHMHVVNAQSRFVDRQNIRPKQIKSFETALKPQNQRMRLI